MSWMICLRYEHLVKTYCERIATCAICSSLGQNKDKHTSTEFRWDIAGKTSKPSQGTAQYSKENQKSPRSKLKNAYPDYSPYENFLD